MNMNAGVKVYLYDALGTVDNDNAHVVFSDPPYGMKSGGHTYFNCNMSKSKSFALEDERFGVKININFLQKYGPK